MDKNYKHRLYAISLGPKDKRKKMKEHDFQLKNNELLPCPFCAGKLEMYIHDDTKKAECCMWDGGATCPSCGVGIVSGFYGWGFRIDKIEESIIRNINRRPKK